MSERLNSGLRKESTRQALSFAIGIAIVSPIIRFGPLRELSDSPAGSGGLLTYSLLVIVLYTSIYTILGALFDHLAFRGMTRRELVISARLTRARTSSWLYRWFYRGRAATGSFQLIALAAVMLVLLVQRPESVPLGLLLVIAVLSMVSSWLGVITAFAVEYAADDHEGFGFEFHGAPAAERLWEEYLHLAVLVQTSAAPSDVTPQTREARRLMRHQSILAYLTNTVVLAVGTSLVFTALASSGL